MARVSESLRALDSRLGLSDLVAALVLAALAVLMIHSKHHTSDIPALKEAEVAPFTIRSPRVVDIEDFDARERERVQLQSQIPELYDFDPGAALVWIEKWKAGVRQMRANRTLYKDPADGMKVLSAKLGVPLSLDEYRTLEKLDFSVDLERSASLAFAPLWDRKIVVSRNFGASGIDVVDLKTEKSFHPRAREVESYLTIEEARSFVGRAAKTLSDGKLGSVRVPWAHWSPAVRGVVFDIQARLVTANVTLNRKASEERWAQSEKQIRPSYQKLERGEVIVREGERVTRREAKILQTLRQQVAGASEVDSLGTQILFGTFALWLLFFFMRRQFPRVLQSNKDSLVAGIFLVSSLAALKLSLIFQLNVLSESLTRVPVAFLVFFVPVAAPAMTLRLLMGVPLTVFFSLLYALGASLVVGKAGLFGLYVLVSSLVGPLTLAHCRTRSSLYRAGFWTALVCGVGAALLLAAWGGHMPLTAGLSSLVDGESGDYFISLPSVLLWGFMGGLCGGWLSSALTLVLTPMLENILDYTTDLKLLELARMDHPLLRELVLKAPGTYHHSIIVGSLVEAGAEAVGANALLARVGSYYHDIGKTGRAEYFIENQTNGHNPHDQTTPQLSAKIIISHVKEGKALAEQHKLGKNIIEFIETHHGMGVVSYFYNKAKQDAAQPGSPVKPEEIEEGEFRYPGPKPRSKECAILALADSCEAATRSLVDPTPARIEGMVNKIVLKAFSEGLLDEADITLSEVALVSKSFLRILLGIHHNRIQYPDQEKGLPSKTVPFAKPTGKTG